jgi:hypothetical protein
LVEDSGFIEKLLRKREKKMVVSRSVVIKQVRESVTNIADTPGVVFVGGCEVCGESLPKLKTVCGRKFFLCHNPLHLRRAIENRLEMLMKINVVNFDREFSNVSPIGYIGNREKFQEALNGIADTWASLGSLGTNRRHLLVELTSLGGAPAKACANIRPSRGFTQGCQPLNEAASAVA